jgi:hypothetical protein
MKVSFKMIGIVALCELGSLELYQRSMVRAGGIIVLGSFES